MRLFFTGGGGAGTEAIWRALWAVHDIHVGDADLEAIDPVIPADRRHRLPWASDRTFVPALQALMQQLEIDLLVPGVDEELLPLSQQAARFTPTALYLPQARYVQTMRDKYLAVQTWRAAGIPTPATRRLDESADHFPFPCLLKPRLGRGSRGVQMIETRVQLDLMRAFYGARASEWIMQERLIGDEYTVQILANRATHLEAIVPLRVEAKRGITQRAVVDYDPAVLALCTLLHEALPTTGAVNVQCIRLADGPAVPFEINPRISTTFCVALAAGLDPFLTYHEAGLDRSWRRIPDGMSFRRTWQNTLTEAHVGVSA